MSVTDWWICGVTVRCDKYRNDTEAYIIYKCTIHEPCSWLTHSRKSNAQPMAVESPTSLALVRSLSTPPHCDIQQIKLNEWTRVHTDFGFYFFKEKNIKISNSHTIQMRARVQLRIPSCFCVIRIQRAALCCYFFFLSFVVFEKGMWKCLDIISFEWLCVWRFYALSIVNARYEPFFWLYTYSECWPLARSLARASLSNKLLQMWHFHPRFDQNVKSAEMWTRTTEIRQTKPNVQKQKEPITNETHGIMFVVAATWHSKRWINSMVETTAASDVSILMLIDPNARQTHTHTHTQAEIICNERCNSGQLSVAHQLNQLPYAATFKLKRKNKATVHISSFYFCFWS